MKRSTPIILKFGLLAGALLLLLKVSEYSMATASFKTEIKLVVFASLFILLGLIIYHLLFRKSIDHAKDYKFDDRKQWELGISNREIEVLELIAGGRSNLEIAESLFISENTVKTHVSNLLLKLNAQRRTEAVRIARGLQLIP